MNEHNKAESLTIITKGTRVTADIITESDIRIAGVVDGDIETKRKLILTKSGEVIGSVTAQEAILEGKLTGEIRTKDQLIVRDTASIDGFIFSKRISVHENAEVAGILNVGEDVDVLKAKSTETPEKPEVKQAVEKATKAVADEKPKDSTPAPVTSPFGETPKSSQTRFHGDVLIGIPSSDVDKNKAKELKAVSENLMNELGFELEIIDDPVFDSFYQKFTYVRKSTDSEKDIQKLYKKGKESLETALLNKGNTEGGSKLQKAADQLIQLFRKFDEFVVILGDIVLVQLLEEEVQTIACEIMPDKLKGKLKKSPDSVLSPSEIYTFIDNN